MGCTDEAAAKFWAAVDKNGPQSGLVPGRCWLWTRGKTKQGYGTFRPNRGDRQPQLVHRLSHQWYIGPIPEGHVVDHLCRVRPCVRPAHLEAVTNEENLRRGAGYALQNGMRTSCINGHEYTDENTYTDPHGGVRCRECARIRDRQPHRLSTLRKKNRKVITHGK